jgi:hypothetical protein
MNETYTGRTVYRRTRVQFSRHPSTGKRLRKVVTRDESEWVEVPDASPRIISPELFVRAQAILESPDRRQRGHATAAYRLRGRLRCIACGTPMTGQALGQGRWRYYRCRSSYTKALGGTCSERYIPRDLLERAVFDELVAVMTDQERLRAEVERAVTPAADLHVSERSFKRELARVGEQQSGSRNSSSAASCRRNSFRRKPQDFDLSGNVSSRRCIGASLAYRTRRRLPASEQPSRSSWSR